MEDQFDDETSVYASEGTAAHAVREACLRDGKNVEEFVGQWIPADDLYFEVTQEWVHWIQPGIDRLREMNGELYTEHRVRLDRWLKGQFGTMDSAVILKDWAIIEDFKFGAGIRVEVKEMKQGMLYALGFYDDVVKHVAPEVDRFVISVDQPRVEGKGGEWEISLEDLLAFGEEARAAADRVAEADAVFGNWEEFEKFLNPTPKGCQFCRAARNSGCRKLDAFVLDLLGIEYSSLTTLKKRAPELADIDEMTPERRSYVLLHKGLIGSWLKNLHGAHLDAAVKGEPTPGFKAVAHLGDREWIDEAEAEAYWRGKVPDRDLYIKKLKSPAQMEAISGTRNWGKAQGLIHRAEGAPVLVPESDKRDALIPLLNLLDDLDLDDENLGLVDQPELDDLI
jgi:hypothetical protein